MFDKEVFKEVLLKARGDRSNEEYAQASDVSRAYISTYLNLNRNEPPGPDVLKKLAEKAHNLVTYEELMVAAGHLKETKLDFDKIRDYVSQKTGISDEELIGQIKAAAERFDKVPILGTIRAGLPILSEGNCEELIDVPSNVKADFGLRITGDSMAWVGIHQGDIALFKESSVGSHGQIVAAGVEAETWEANLKFYIQQNGKVFLRSANPNYEDIVYGPNHRIVGNMVAVIKESPSLYDYRNVLQNKEYIDQEWTEMIEYAVGAGLTPEDLKKLIDFHATLKK